MRLILGLRVAMAWCVLSVAASISYAQDVVLTSRDGSVEINGTFRSYDGENYRVETQFGVLTVEASGVKCDGPGCPDIDSFYARIRIAGDQRMLDDLARPMADAFARRNGYQISWTQTETGARGVLSADQTVGEFVLLPASDDTLFAELFDEDADIILTRRPANASEVEAGIRADAGDMDDPVRARVVALDALAPMVPQSNKVAQVTLADLRSILTGDIENWQDIGGEDAPISVHVRQPDLATGRASDSALLPGQDQISSTATLHADMAALVDAVSKDPFAIGMGLVSAGGDVRHLALSGACGFLSVAGPTEVKTKDYPLARPAFYYTGARRLPKLAREYLAYLVSPEGQGDVARTSFVDQSVSALPIGAQGHRLANAILRVGEEITVQDVQDAVRTLSDGRRLSIGFRFKNGASSLDAQSKSNARLLGRLLASGLYDGQEVMFVGHSDGIGDAGPNREISRARAMSVRSAVFAAAGDAFEPERLDVRAIGMGEIMPLGCDDTLWGRALNRRVEVWVKDIPRTEN